jgi:hypothetical protein
VLKVFGFVLAGMMSVACLRAQEQQPKVRINYLNVCTPSEAEEAEIAAGLARLPVKPSFALDFEVARGRSSGTDVPIEGAGEAGPSSWVRIRREFRPDSPFSSVQYSFSLDGKSAVETLVFRLREAKDLLQISLQDTVSAANGLANVLAADTPPNRIKLERFGRSGLALARCPGAEQARYEPLFRSAAQIMAAYRDALGARRTVPADLARLNNPGGVAKRKKK